jgi:predicted kinase
VIAQRLRERAGSVSDADEEIGRALAAHADPWPQAAPIPTGGSVPDALAAARLQCDQDHPAS